MALVRERLAVLELGRLRHPAPSEVAAIVGFALPADLIPFFEQAPFIDRNEFQLIRVAANVREFQRFEPRDGPVDDPD